MALLDVSSVVQAVATLHDDPSQSKMDGDYVIPFINLRWANLIVNMAMLGLQYSEEMAVFAVPSGTVSLTNFMLNGQPLASLMQPISIDWKLVGDDDSEYQSSVPVRELDDLAQGSQGVLEYSWQGGTILVTPSAVPVTARVRFQALSTNLVDPTDGMIRGVGDIIAFRAAELIYDLRGNVRLKQSMKEYGDTALDDFLAMSVMRSQANLIRLLPTHQRACTAGGALFIARN